MIVRYYFVSRLVSTSHVKTSALVRDQFQVWLYHYCIEVLDTAVVLKQSCTISLRYILTSNRYPHMDKYFSPNLFDLTKITICLFEVARTVYRHA